MSGSKIISATATIIFVFAIAAIDKTVAGEKEKIQTQDPSYTTKMHQLEVGDEEGHVVVIFENKSVYYGKITGEKMSDSGVGFLDINPKTGKMFGKGYVVNTGKDGDKMIQTWEGKHVAKGQWKGTWAIIKCTGKYEGTKASGTWTSYNLTPQQGYVEVNVEIETPYE